MADEKMTVGGLRDLIKDLPDDATYFPDWANGPPGDADPGVTVEGFRVREGDGGERYLSVLVDVIYLDDIEAEEADDSDF